MVHPRYGAEEGRLLLFVRCVRTVCLLHFTTFARLSRVTRDTRVVHRVIRDPCAVCVFGFCAVLLSLLSKFCCPPRHRGLKNKMLCVCFSVHCVASRISLHGLCKRHRDRKVAIALVGRECISEVHRSMNITHPPQRL